MVSTRTTAAGYFIENDDVDHYVFIQAPSSDEFYRIANGITSNYSEYCECCGERWYYSRNEEGSKEPEIYGESVYTTTRTHYSERAILYYYDGRKERVTFADTPKCQPTI